MGEQEKGLRGGVYLGLGSNAENGEEFLQRARQGLDELFGVTVLAKSKLYLTEPQDYRQQPWFFNQVLELGLDQSWQPLELWQELFALEARLGRQRDLSQPRFGPRTIDLDLLLFGELTLNTLTLTLPHPRMHQRAFVLYPLLEIAPNLLLYGEKLTSHLARLTWRRVGQRLYQS